MPSLASTLPFLPSIHDVLCWHIHDTLHPFYLSTASVIIRKQKSYRTGLAYYYACLSHELSLMPMEGDAHIHQPIGQKQFQENKQAHG